MKLTAGKPNKGFPDVCMTPTPAGPVPVPYPNVNTSKIPAVAKTVMQTKGISSKGAEVLSKGKFPSGLNDKLRFSNKMDVKAPKVGRATMMLPK